MLVFWLLAELEQTPLVVNATAQALPGPPSGGALKRPSPPIAVAHFAVETPSGSTTTSLLTPNGDGDLSEWDESLDGNHVENIDDGFIPDDDTTYIQNALQTNPGATDLFTHAGTIPGPNTVSNVSVVFRGRQVAAESGVQVAAALKIGETIAVGTFRTLSGAFASFTQAFSVNPVTGKSWLASEVNALQFGVRAGEAVNDGCRVTQVYLSVTHRKPTYQVGSAGAQELQA